MPETAAQSQRSVQKHAANLETAVARIEALENHIDALLDADTEGELHLPDYIRAELVELHNDGDYVPKESA